VAAGVSAAGSVVCLLSDGSDSLRGTILHSTSDDPF